MRAAVESWPAWGLAGLKVEVELALAYGAARVRSALNSRTSTRPLSRRPRGLALACSGRGQDWLGRR